ncbi:protein O-linked-mannose beta-1,4-N-acetylglucosaminyltransferase 2-like [Liolophura sinensis]|uniref:protein O-linked-mannose beta-1,4-N-acetylglucosaminyltransferase 2-like n=1 Tax=Liolophura sinensis TaxID=3198878 RepID=UPI0031593F7F
MDQTLLQTGETICFKTAYFGTSRFPFDDRRLVQDYITFIKNQFEIPVDKQPDTVPRHRIGIITRNNSRGRKILNEAELKKAISHLATVDIVEFSGKSFKEQVSMIQRYSVLVGMNGAGLTNAIYLPRTSVAVQLVPYNASLNFRDFGVWLSSRGPYLEWHNTHPELSETDKYDVFNNRANTLVPESEFLKLMTDAISIVDTRRFREKAEL